MTIVTVNFNYGRFLEEAIRSVLLQSYPNIQYIVVDGGSSDGSQRVVERYAADISQFITEPDEGPADALSKGLRRAEGDIVGWLNADDFLLPGAIERGVRVLLDTGADAIYGHRIVVDEWSRITGFRLAPRRPSTFRWRCGSWIPQESVLLRRASYEQVGGVRPDSVAFDYDLFLRMYSNGASFRSTGEFAGAFRRHGESLSIAQHRQLREEVLCSRRDLLRDDRADRFINRVCDLCLRRLLLVGGLVRRSLWSVSGRFERRIQGLDLERPLT